MRHPDARARSLALVRLAAGRATRRGPGRRRGPDAAGDGVTVGPPRTPTPTGGATAALDA